MKIIADIIREEKKWGDHKKLHGNFIKSVIKKTLSHFSPFKKVSEVEVALLLSNNNKLQNLNNQFRGKNKPTNVLSFPDIDVESQKILEFQSLKDYITLGDIAFSYETIKLEAEEQNKSFEDHFTHLLVHGILHLIGFDHEISKKDAEEMESLEIEILKTLLISSPY